MSVTRTLDRYPSGLELLRFLRAHAPQVVFVSTESTAKAMEIAREVDKNTPGVQIVAVSRFVDPQILLEVMRAGIREFASLPFDRQTLVDALVRIKDAVQARPPAIEATNQVYSFLPSKAGVGTSTVAMNTAMAMSRVQDSSVLLSDFDLNSGMVRFMLKLDSAYCVTDAAEHALEMDESLWPTMVTTDRQAGRAARREIESGLPHRADADPPSDGVHAAQLHVAVLRHVGQPGAVFARDHARIEAHLLSVHAGDSFAAPGAREISLPETAGSGRARQRAAEPLPETLADLAAADRAIAGRSDLHDLPERLSGRATRHDGGRWVEASSELGRQFTSLAQSMLEAKAAPAPEPKKRFIEFFSVVPGKAVDAGPQDRGITQADQRRSEPAGRQDKRSSGPLVHGGPSVLPRPGNLALQGSCSRAECHLAAIIEILFPNPGHLQLQPLAGPAESIDERIRLRRYE